MSDDRDSESDDGGAKAICVSLEGGEEQHERWKDEAAKYFPSLSAMIVYFVERGIEEMEGDDSESPKHRSVKKLSRRSGR